MRAAFAAALALAFALASPEFATAGNAQNLMMRLAVDGVVAVGMTLLIIAGGFDLSVGSVMALAGIVTALTLPAGLPLALAAGLLTGAVVGVLNGVLVQLVGINAFIATLATMVIVRGLALTVTDTRPLYAPHAGYAALGTTTVLGVPLPAVLFLLLLAAGAFVLRHTVFGRNLYAVGGSEDGSRLAGVPVTATRVAAYGLAGLAAGLGGILLSARLTTASPIFGQDAPLTVIAAVILGGNRLLGGVGGMGRTLIGLSIVAMLSNGLNLLAVPSYYQMLAKGAVLVLAVVLDSALRGEDS
jgi:ribose transport system permease protein